MKFNRTVTAVSLLILLALAACAKTKPAGTPLEVPAFDSPTQTSTRAAVVEETAQPTQGATVEVLPSVTPTIDPRLPASVLVDGRGFVLGGAQNGAWLSPREASLALPAGGAFQVYQNFQPGGQSQVSAPVQRQASPCEDAWVVSLTPAVTLDTIAFFGPWSPALREVKSMTLPSLPVEQALVGLLPDTPATVQGIEARQTDLDGDGRMEILASAGGESTPPLAAVLVQQPDGSYLPHLLALETSPSADDYRFIAALDLNGDGRMEVVLLAQQGDTANIRVFEVGQAGATEVMSSICACNGGNDCP